MTRWLKYTTIISGSVLRKVGMNKGLRGVRHMFAYLIAIAACVIAISCSDDDDSDDNTAVMLMMAQKQSEDSSSLVGGLNPSKDNDPAYSSKGLKYEKRSDGKINVTGFDENSYDGHKDILIPDEIDGIKVVCIGSHSFEGSDITSVKISDAVTGIYSSAFYNCKSLKSVTLSDNVTTIGDDAFFGCSSLKKVNLPKRLETVYSGAFARCTSLETVDIPEEIATVNFMYMKDKSHVFNGCNNLSSSSKRTLLAIGYDPNCPTLESRFEYYNNGDGTITINGFKSHKPSEVRMIIPAYIDGMKVKRVEAWSSTLLSICSYAKTIIISRGIEEIGDNFSSGCDNLKSVTLPDTLVSIGNFAFSNKEKLKSISFPASLKKVGEGAFWDCASLTTVTVQKGIGTVDFGVLQGSPHGLHCFDGCASLSSVSKSVLKSIGYNYEFY